MAGEGFEGHPRETRSVFRRWNPTEGSSRTLRMPFYRHHVGHLSVCHARPYSSCARGWAFEPPLSGIGLSTGHSLYGSWNVLPLVRNYKGVGSCSSYHSQQTQYCLLHFSLPTPPNMSPIPVLFLCATGDHTATIRAWLLLISSLRVYRWLRSQYYPRAP